MKPKMNSEISSQNLSERKLDLSAQALTLADCTLPTMPLVYVNTGFERLTGYSRDEVLGTNCRFLQGERTSLEAISKVREAIRTRDELLIDLLNYRKDGSAFWNRLSIRPVTDAGGKLTHYIGIQTDITRMKYLEHQLSLLAGKIGIHQILD